MNTTLFHLYTNLQHVQSTCTAYRLTIQSVITKIIHESIFKHNITCILKTIYNYLHTAFEANRDIIYLVKYLTTYWFPCDSVQFIMFT